MQLPAQETELHVLSVQCINRFGHQYLLAQDEEKRLHLKCMQCIKVTCSAVCRASAEAAQAKVAELQRLEQQLQQALRGEAEWQSKPSSSYIGAALIGEAAK